MEGKVYVYRSRIFVTLRFSCVFPALDMNYNEKDHQICTLATKPLLNAVDSLVSFACSPEFLNRSSHFGDSTLSAQEPILSAGEAIIESSCSMIKTAKTLAVSPKDRPTWKLLADHSKQVSDSIKRLVTSIRWVEKKLGVILVFAMFILLDADMERIA